MDPRGNLYPQAHYPSGERYYAQGYEQGTSSQREQNHKKTSSHSKPKKAGRDPKGNSSSGYEQRQVDEYGNEYEDDHDYYYEEPSLRAGSRDSSYDTHSRREKFRSSESQGAWAPAPHVRQHPTTWICVSCPHLPPLDIQMLLFYNEACYICLAMLNNS